MHPSVKTCHTRHTHKWKYVRASRQGLQGLKALRLSSWGCPVLPPAVQSVTPLKKKAQQAPDNRYLGGRGYMAGGSIGLYDWSPLPQSLTPHPARQSRFRDVLMRSTPFAY